MSDSDKHGQRTPKAKPKRLAREDFASRDDAVEALIGQRPDDAAAREADWYQRVRVAMRQARDDSGKGQIELAQDLGVAQSEVSRLETSLGPGTRLGKLRGYLDACAARMTLAVETAAGAVHEIGAARATVDTLALEPETVAVPDFVRGWSPWSAMSVIIEDVALQGRDLQYLTSALPALDAAMADAGLDPERAKEIRHRFLVRFRQVRGRDTAAPVTNTALTQTSE